MNPLTQRILKIAAFDVEYIKREALRLHNIERNDEIERRWINVGVILENARLRPLIERLAEPTTALERIAKQRQRHEPDEDGEIYQPDDLVFCEAYDLIIADAREALTALERLVSEMEGE